MKYLYWLKMEGSIFLIVVLCSCAVDCSTMGFTKLLLEDLFQNYSKDIRPVQNQTNPVTVSMTVDVISINDFDEVAGTISMVVILYISWNDQGLVWNSTSYGNTTLLTFKQDKIWLPEMFLCNLADEFVPIGDKAFKLTVTSDGNVLWIPGALLIASCTPDVYKYPFDQQICSLRLGPWGYSNQQVKLNLPSKTLWFTYFSTNSEWEVKGSNTSVWVGTFDLAYFYITIERRHMNFLVSVVIPVIMLAFVNIFVFILPYNSGERASYSITVLLAFTVYMTVVSDKMPASSQPISYISYYLLSLVGISVAIVTMNIFQIRTYSKHDNDEPVPKWIRKSYLYTQNIFRRRKIDTTDQLERSVAADSTMNAVNDKGMYHLGLDFSNRDSVMPLSKDQEKPNIDNESVVPAKRPTAITWHMVAKVLDKAYFVVFFLVTVAVTCSYFISVL
ncbi:acetylcholine receptor subunit alpha-like [Argopecten irradians]|uniref:acetylcholine receptor subunit alpha-like n=1 Tax=Argopecten irradians TaxID=31199 RepID=UPI00371B3D71